MKSFGFKYRVWKFRKRNYKRKMKKGVIMAHKVLCKGVSLAEAAAAVRRSLDAAEKDLLSQSAYDDFKKELYIILKRAVLFSHIVRHKGILALEELLDLKKIAKRDIFEYGMRFVVDGCDYNTINNILTNIINQEKDEYSKTLKIIQKEAVLAIQSGLNTRITLEILNSYTDIPYNDEFKKAVYSDDLEFEKYLTNDNECKGALSADEIEALLKGTLSADEIEASLARETSLQNARETSLQDARETSLQNEGTDKASYPNEFSRKFLLMEDRAIQKVLRETDRNDLAKALKRCNKTAAQKIFKNISRRAAIMLKEEMDYMGLVRLKDIEESQKKMLAVIRHLEDTGEILIYSTEEIK